MNEIVVNKNSLKDFQEETKNIQSMKSLAELPFVLADLHLKGVNALFKFQPDEDLKDPTEKIMNADQAGLGLPTAEYYISENKDFVELRNNYLDLAEYALKKLGLTKEKAKTEAKKVIDLETNLARASWSPAERRDTNKLYNRIDRKGLLLLSPKFGWENYFRSLGTPDLIFFLSLGQAWCSKASLEYEKFQTNSDPHPVDRFRVNGSVRNISEFGKAFMCKEGAPLAPKNRCIVW